MRDYYSTLLNKLIPLLIREVRLIGKVRRQMVPIPVAGLDRAGQRRVCLGLKGLDPRTTRGPTVNMTGGTTNGGSSRGACCEYLYLVW